MIQEKDAVVKKASRIYERDAAYENAYIRSSRINLFLIITITLMSIVIWKQSGNKPLIVGLNEIGVPYHLQQSNKTVPGPEQTELFIREFISLVDSFSGDSWKNNQELAMSMMTNDFMEVYKKELQRSNYGIYVEENDVTQTATVKGMRLVESKRVKGENFFRASILVSRTRIAKGIPSSETMEFALDLKQVPITTSRYGLYGLKVAGMQRKPVKQE